MSDNESPELDEENRQPQTPARPSAKALGKRKAAVPEDNDCESYMLPIALTLFR